MRLHYGAIPHSDDFHPETEGWNALREPSPLMFQVWTFPVAVLNLAVLALLWMLCPFLTTGNPGAFATGAWIVLITFIPVHELLHAIVTPEWGCSNKTLIGVWPQRLLFYAHYHGQMPRNRFLWVFATPFIVLSLLPIPLAMVLSWATGDGTYPMVLRVLSFINGLAACGDVLAMGMILKQIPADAIVRNQGWNTYWKLPENQTPQELQEL